MMYLVTIHYTNNRVHELTDGTERYTIDRVLDPVLYWIAKLTQGRGWDLFNVYTGFGRLNEYRKLGLDVDGNQHTTFVFEDKRDAAMFKLRWA